MIRSTGSLQDSEQKEAKQNEMDGTSLFRLTRPISHSSIEGRPNNPNIEGYLPMAQAFDVLEVCKSGYAREAPLR